MKLKPILLATSLSTIAIVTPITVVSCGNAKHVIMKDSDKTQTLNGSIIATYPFELSEPWKSDEDIRVDEITTDPNWDYSLAIQPTQEVNKLELRFTLNSKHEGIKGQTFNFDASICVFKTNGGATVWSETITGLKLIYQA